MQSRLHSLLCICALHACKAYVHALVQYKEENKFATSKRCAHLCLSRVLSARNLINATLKEGPWLMLTWPCMFMMETVLDRLQTTKCSGFLGRAWMEFTVMSVPMPLPPAAPRDLKVLKHSVLLTLHSLTVPSELALSRWLLSGVKMTSFTNDVWPRNSLRSFPDLSPWILQPYPLITFMEVFGSSLCTNHVVVQTYSLSSDQWLCSRHNDSEVRVNSLLQNLMLKHD